MRATAETARLLAREAGDDPDDRSAGLITLVQTKVTGILMRPQESQGNDDPFARARLPATASKNIATLTRTSADLGHYQTEVRERVEHAAAAVEKVAHKGGLFAEAAQVLRREALGAVS